MTPVMYVDPRGEFFILGTILLTTTIGAIIGGSLSLTIQLIENDFDRSNVSAKPRVPFILQMITSRNRRIFNIYKLSVKNT